MSCETVPPLWGWIALMRIPGLAPWASSLRSFGISSASVYLAPRDALAWLNRKPFSATALNLFQWSGGVAEGLWPEAHLVHQREIQPAHLAVRFAGIIEHSSALDASASAAEHHHWKLRGGVIAGRHGGAHHEHGIVKRGGRAFLGR